MVTDLAGRFGMSTQAAAVLMIVFGVLILVLPALLPWLVGFLLIILGVLGLLSGGAGTWLAARRETGEPPRRV